MKAKITGNRKFTVGEIDPRLYGSFIEHLGRAVYEGIYEPDHPSADDQGFRGDVLELVKKLNVPIVRYPGGNFVSGYRWEDGTGDKAKRPKRMDLAWGAVETNEVGVDEFQEWAKRAGSEVMMTVNLGTRGVQEAADLVEYCNAETDTHFAELRRKNGFEKPFGVKVWCLGNEMDGPWQLGHKTAEQYGLLAAEAAKMMKRADRSVELVACGATGWGRCGDWDYEMLDHTYGYVDYISLHTYFSNKENDPAKYLAKVEDANDYINGVAALCDAVKAKKKSHKTINLSYDEWNVWYHSVEADRENRDADRWTRARHQLEDIYNFEDALVVGSMLMTLQNHADRVKIACLAQLVNVIAPIMTEKGGKAWAQTIFYPFFFASNYGRGTALRALTESGTYDVEGRKDVPYLVASVIYNAEAGEVTVFAVNRSLEEEMELEVALEDFGACALTEHTELYADDLKAVNEKDAERVAPVRVGLRPDGKILLKKHSWNMLRYRVNG
ncbi:MAG: alpha-N-arabinofuranosidase [Clostridia bacterium]|nr:alpha-N-arabinofuranosidase [Clostridia bacterium]